MSSSSDRELEEQLLDAGNKLIDPPSSDDELLLLLDKVENCLSRVEQSPTISMQNALSPSLRALVCDKVLEHPIDDVRVAVASCISEITRITAPDAPYDDDQMKEVFRLIVSSFENLSDNSSPLYNKRASILETVSKVRSCVVMLDLECDALIVEMFKHFFKAIRDHHPDNVFLSMETIMTLVLEESEEISAELLSPILASVKKDKEILPIARRLGERVLEISASKVKPYLIQAVKSLGISLEDYSQIVVAICEQDASSAVEQNDDATSRQMAEDSKVERTSLEDAPQVDKETATEEASPECVDPDIENSPKSVVSNDNTQTGEDEPLLDLNSKKQQESSNDEEHDHHADESKSTKAVSNAEDNHHADESKSANALSNAEDHHHADESNSTNALSNAEDHRHADESKSTNALKNAEDEHSADESKSTHALTNAELDNMPGKVECKLEQGTKKKGRKPSSSKSKEPSDGSHDEGGEEDHQAKDSKFTNALNDAEDDHHADKSKTTNALNNAERDDMTGKAECKLEQSTKKRGRKPSSSKSKEPSDCSHAEGEKEAEEPLDCQKNNGNDDASSPYQEPATEVAVTSDIVKDKKAPKSESGNVDSPPPSGGAPEEGRLRNAGRPKKKETSTKDATPSADVSSKVSEATSDPEGKAAKRSGKKVATRVSIEDTNATTVASKKESAAAGDSEVKASKQSAKQEETSGDNEERSLKQQEDKKKQGRVKAVIEKDVTESLAKDDSKEVVASPKSNTKSTKDEDQLEETPLTNSKRKRTPVVEKASDDKEGEDLVGSKIKVWWPKDRMFYEGVVDSYDSIKKRHKILYIDGDEEVLNLKRQKWVLVARDSESDEGEEADESSPDASSDVPQKKKVKTNSGQSAKAGNSSSKRGRGASSSKVKGSATKSGRADSKAKVHTPKSGNKSASLSKASNKSKDDDAGATKNSKSKDAEVTPKTSTKSKLDTPKSNESKQDTQKAVNKSRGKTPKGGGKSNAGGSGKVKPGSSKVKETEDVEDASFDSEVPESAQGKSVDSSKAKGNKTKTGNKRRRGARS